MSRAGLPSRLALPLPTGEPGWLREAAGRMRCVAAAAADADIVQGRVGQALAEVWSGPAAAAATAEAGMLAARARALVSGIPRAADALDRYAGSLEEAVRSVRALQLRWDEVLEDHRRALAALESVAGLGSPEQHILIERLRAGHRATLTALEARHERQLSELGAAGRACAAAVHEVNAGSFPGARGTSVAEVRSHLIAGLSVAEDAALALATRDRALCAAAEWRRLGRASSSEDVDHWVRANEAAAADPAFAQAWLEEVGVERALATVAELGRAGGPVALESVQHLLAVTGTLVLAATAPPGASRGAWSRRQEALVGDRLRRDLVEQMSTVFESADGRTRSTGSWIFGQLLVGARQAGRSGAIPTGLLTRLVSAAAASEIAETRDTDIERRHGTTLRPDGGRQFASYFADGNATGDVLHLLLLEAGDDLERQQAVLGMTIGPPTLANARGDDLVLAEHLVRRWISHDLAGMPAMPAARLATDDDLLRLLGTAAGDGSQAAAALRARVMAELARTSAYAQQEYSTIRSYADHSGPLEEAAVGWVLAMRHSVDQSLVASPPTSSAAYSIRTPDGYQPLLRLEELTGVVGSFAVATDLRSGGKEPGAGHRLLVTGELESLRERALAGEATEQDVIRIAYYDRAASAALMQLARQQDAYNETMWKNLAEVRSTVMGLRLDPVGTVAAIVGEGTARTAFDEMAISIVRSDVTVAQAQADEARTAGLTAALRLAVGAGARCLARPVDDLVAEGARLGPAVPTSEDVRRRRRAEIRDRIADVLGDATTEGAGETSRTGR